MKSPHINPRGIIYIFTKCHLFFSNNYLKWLLINLGVRKGLFKIEKVKKEEEEKIINSSISTCVENITRKVMQDSQKLRLSRNDEEDLPRIRNNSFHSEFILFRSTLQLKRVLRKTRIDSLLKKCKSKVFRTIQEAINLLTNLSNNKDNRLPQSFITNINIEYNKKYLLKPLEQIYRDCNIFNSTDHLIQENPSMSEEDKAYLKILLSMTHKDAFESYIKSSRYQSDYNYIRQREGEKYAILFDYVAKIYVLYFLNGRGNQKRVQSFEGPPPVIEPSKIKFRGLKLKKRIVFKTYQSKIY